MSGEGFLSRWSRRKRASTTGRDAPALDAAPAPAAAPSDSGTVPATVPDAEPAPPQPLPSIESLTADSDFAPFMRPDVDEGLRRQALKKLFQDARFNVMDGLDVYIDDYSKPDPLPEGWLEKLEQVKRLGSFREAEEEAAEAGAKKVARPQLPPDDAPKDAPKEVSCPDRPADSPAAAPEAGITPVKVGKSPDFEE